MKDLLNIEILTKTFDDLPAGVGIFQVPDIKDIKSIRYVFMNKVLLYEMRKNREEVFGKTILEVAPEAYEHEGGLQVIETYRKVAEEGGTINLGLVEYSNHMVAGTYECSVHHIQDNYVYVMLRNVTELEQAKNDLELKNEELTQFAHLVSHDLKEPLRTISGFVNLIEQKYADKLDKQTNGFLRFISEATGRMRNVINDLLDYSSIGAGKVKVELDCNDLLKVVQQDLEARIKDSNATIEVGELPIIKGYETELRLLFQNLISNGIKFSKADVTPKITISVEKNNCWTFKIQDNGIGIAEENHDKIFSIFRRLHTKMEYEGSGVGLAHCKKIADLHNGEILVASVPGEGSTFYVKLPIHEKVNNGF